MKFLSFALIVCLLVGSVMCDDDSDREESMWSKLKEMVNEVFEKLRSFWKEMTEEIKTRTAEMSSWTKETFESFKIKMKEWVDSKPGIPETEKDDMRNYIEKLQMPTENPRSRK